MLEDPQQITQFLDSIFSHGTVWIYLIIVVACFIENILPPWPGDSFVVAAGALVGAARLDFVPALLSVVVGGMSSVMLVYFLGRKYGHDYFMRRDFKYFSASDIVKVEGYLKRWGGVILIFSRFVVGFRSPLALVAGIGRYHAAKMLLYSLVSYLIFAVLLLYIAMMAVENLDRIGDFIVGYSRVILLVLAMMLAVYIFHRFRKLRGRSR
ncbi:MAG: DedA family protein [bacterium]